MSYKFFSLKTCDEHDVAQWSSRTLEGELKAFEARTLSAVFEKYLHGKECRVLEGGCGFGAWCEWFQRRGHDAIGLEYNATVVSAAKKFKSDVKVELGNIMDIKYPNNYFDAYVSLGVIEHFEMGPELALIEAKRILKNDALAFITTPYLNKLREFICHPIRNMVMFVARLAGKKPQFWEYRFTEQELVHYIQSAGFEIIEVAVDDYPASENKRHIGLWADWFFLRKSKGEIWELNCFGKLVLKFLHFFPEKLYCSGLLVVARPIKQ